MKRTNFYLNAAASALFAIAMSASFQSCAIADNPSNEDDPVVDPRIKNAEEFLAAVNAGQELIELAPNAIITLTEPLVLTKQVEIKGVEEKEATLIVADGGITISDNFTLNNVDINASANTKALITLNSEPTVGFFEGSEYYGIDYVKFISANLLDVKGSIIWDGNAKYCVKELTFENCGIILNTESTNNQAFVSFQAGGVKDFTFKCSTVTQRGEEENNYFLRYNNSARLDRFGFDKETMTQSINYINCTFYKVGKNGQWGNYNGFAGQKYSEWHVVNNIWVDCGNGQISRRILGGRNASSYNICEFANNTYWFNGAPETGNESYDASIGLDTDPAFKDIASGDFTPTGAKQVELKTGDPFWFK